jgi:hypothetical protein
MVSKYKSGGFAQPVPDIRLTVAGGFLKKKKFSGARNFSFFENRTGNATVTIPCKHYSRLSKPYL